MPASREDVIRYLYIKISNDKLLEFVNWANNLLVERVRKIPIRSLVKFKNRAGDEVEGILINKGAKNYTIRVTEPSGRKVTYRVSRQLVYQ